MGTVSLVSSRSNNLHSDPEVLVKTALTKFKNALELLDKHLANHTTRRQL